MNIPFHALRVYTLSTFLNVFMNKHQIKRLIFSLNDTKICPICNCSDVAGINFKHNNLVISKYYCKSCFHIFSNNLNKNIQKANELFLFSEKSIFYEKQKKLQQLLLKNYIRYNKEPGVFLDFGVGGNTEIIKELNKKYLPHKFYACDLFSASIDNYFQTYSLSTPYNIFDGISSHAVVEHLDNTIEAFSYFNRLLKPLKNGGGIMIHSFPSTIVDDLWHWSIKIASHECIFSKKSLELICNKTGFQLIGVKIFTSAVHPLYYFTKIKDI
jgi:SAM-dependent methyltransferase